MVFSGSCPNEVRVPCFAVKARARVIVVFPAPDVPNSTRRRGARSLGEARVLLAFSMTLRAMVVRVSSVSSSIGFPPFTPQTSARSAVFPTSSASFQSGCTLAARSVSYAAAFVRIRFCNSFRSMPNCSAFSLCLLRAFYPMLLFLRLFLLLVVPGLVGRRTYLIVRLVGLLRRQYFLTWRFAWRWLQLGRIRCCSLRELFGGRLLRHGFAGYALLWFRRLLDLGHSYPL